MNIEESFNQSKKQEIDDILWKDFSLFISVIMFRKLCLESENPELECDGVLKVWRDRIESKLKKYSESYSDDELKTNKFLNSILGFENCEISYEKEIEDIILILKKSALNSFKKV